MADESTDAPVEITSETDVTEVVDTESTTEGETSPDETDPNTFPRSYVEDLRQENGKYRQRAQRADDLAHRLHTELVRATGRLADPSDLPFDEDHLADADKMAAAIGELLAGKPHLASRRPTGNIGQGATPSAGTVDLAAMLRQRA
ncbi:hypothetical protein [Mycolicibacter algericus]|uniref:hypothetical protein n=1 Tax=Mycolicibacter algericus TaxID=1288388 RepID=UPI003C754D0A